MAAARGTRTCRFFLLLSSLAALVWSQSSQEPLGGLSEIYDWPEEPNNRVSNPSFEDLDGANKPAGWKLGEPKSWTIDSSTKHSGRASLLLSDSHLARYTPLAIQSLSLEPGWYSLGAFAKADHAGTLGEDSGGRISLGNGHTRVLSGTTGWVPLDRRNILISAGDSALRIEAYRKPDGRLYFDDISVRRLVPPAIEGFLHYPNYRGALFEDAPQTIVLSVTGRPDLLDGSGGEVLVRASLEGPGGAIVAASEERIPAGEPRQVSLDASQAPLGRLLLRLQALHSSSRASLYEYPSYSIVKLSKLERSALRSYVDFDNVLVIDGRRRFPLGIYDTSGRSSDPGFYAERLSKIAEGSFTLYLNYWLGGASKGEIEALTTALRSFGMSYIHTANAWYESNPNWDENTPCGPSQAGELGEAGFTSCKARELSEVSGLAGWYTADERPADAAAAVFEQYRLLRQGDRDGVTFIAQNRPGEIARWRDAADVMGVDPYPIYNVPEGSLSPLEMVSNWVRSANSGVVGSRPVWAVIQFFQHGSKGHWPTYDELRTMSYMAIVSGAKGLFYWSYGAIGLERVKDPATRDIYWRRLTKVTHEIAGLEEVLLAPDSPNVVESISSGEQTAWLAKELNGSSYLIVVNQQGEPIEARIALKSSSSRVDVLEEDRSIAVSRGSFSDSFRPYEAHVYRTR